MLLHKGLTQIHSQKKPNLHFGESFTLRGSKNNNIILETVVRAQLTTRIVFISIMLNQASLYTSLGYAGDEREITKTVFFLL